MKLFLNTENFEVPSLTMDKMNFILSFNAGGKTTFLNEIRNSFEGKNKNGFLFQGETVNKGDYFVYHIEETSTMDIESSLTAKTLSKGYLNTAIDGMGEDIKNLLNQKLEELLSNINENILIEYDDDLYGLRTQINIQDLIIKNTQVMIGSVSLKKQSFSEKRIAYIDLIIKSIYKINQPSILMIDEFDLGLSKYEAENLLEKLKKLACKEDVYVFVTSSNYFKSTVNYMFVNKRKVENEILNQNEINRLIAQEEKCSIEDVGRFVTEEERKSFIQSKKIDEHVIDFLLSGFNSENKYKNCCVFYQDNVL